MENQTNDLSYVIAYAVVNDRENLLSFLQSQGIPLDKKNILDTDIPYIIINSISESPVFSENFLKWINSKIPSDYSNFDFDPLNLGSSSTSTSSTSSGDGFWGGANFSSISSLVSGGLGLFGTLTQSKDQKAMIEAQANAQIAAANASASNSATQLQIAQTMLEAEKVKLQGKPAASNTGLIIGLSVLGVAVLGTVIYFVTRKK